MTENRPSDVPGPGPEEARGDDLSLLGHDIRAAVSDIVGGLRLIDADALPEAQKAQFARIRVAGEELAALVDEALMRAAGQEARESAGAFALGPYLQDTAARWAANADAAGTTFRMEAAEDLPEALSLDRLALDRILSNLLFNAVKYADGSEVVLCVRQCADGAVSFRVRDGGAGFSQEALSLLFQRNSRPAGSRPGSGLGLHVAKLQADALGAEMRVTSRAGIGAEVLLRLPPGVAAGRPVEPGAVPDLCGLRILLAEDNATSQLLIGGMLRRMGAEVEIVGDGLDAADALAGRRFDLALLDIEMPGLTGIDLIAALRDAGTAVPPLIALTAYVLRSNRDAIFAAGADGIIAKPVASAADFGRAIRRHVDYAATRSQMDWPAEPAAAADALTQFDQARFDDLMAAAGPEEGAELTLRLAADLQSVDRLLADGDSDEIRAQTHILIALAGAVGAARLQDRAERLNRLAHAGRRQDAARLLTEVREDIAGLLGRLAAEG